MKLSRVVGYVVGAVLTVAIGWAILTRIPGAMALLSPRSQA